MNDKSRGKVSLKVFTKVYDIYPDTRDFVDKSLEDVCSRENLPLDQVFPSLFWFYLLLHLLWALAAF